MCRETFPHCVGELLNLLHPYCLKAIKSSHISKVINVHVDDIDYNTDGDNYPCNNFGHHDEAESLQWLNILFFSILSFPFICV